VDSATSTTKVKATVTSSAGAPLIGAPVVAHVSFAGPPAIRVPWTSLTSTSEGAAVWTVDSATMTVQLAPVVVRDYKVDGVVIDQGLSDGQMVVGAGSQMLYPGRPVIAAEVQP
jgi:multidrug efflux pump subunit AcrA (membrane-fusion protein)